MLESPAKIRAVFRERLAGQSDKPHRLRAQVRQMVLRSDSGELYLRPLLAPSVVERQIDPPEADINVCCLYLFGAFARFYARVCDNSSQCLRLHRRMAAEVLPPCVFVPRNPMSEIACAALKKQN